jgi:nitrogen fixation protein NifX
MIKITFASKDGLHVNEHFGWCEKFYMYSLDEEKIEFLKEIDSSQKHEAEFDKLEYKIECLEDSNIVYVLQIGPKAANMVNLAGIYPLKAKDESEKIEDVLEHLQSLLKEDTPLWLKRIALKAAQ